MADSQCDHGLSEETFARIVWGAHILNYLSRNRGQSALVSSVDLDEDDGEDEEDIDSTFGTPLTSSDESMRTKFLDCLAGLLSHTKGWHQVTVTAFREYEDAVNVDVSRNAGFDIQGIDGSSGTDGAYFASFQKFMASQNDSGRL